MCGFIAQLVEHRTGIAEVTGSNPVQALIFCFQASSFRLLKAGVQAVFWPGIMFLMQISCLRFKQSRISMLISHIYV